MTNSEEQKSVRVWAKSPGKYPILVLELSSGELRTAYYETGYDLESTKPVEEGWLRENAIGRHSFIEIEPAEEVAAEFLQEYARRETPEES